MSRIPVQFSLVTHSQLLRPPWGLILSLVPKPVHNSNLTGWVITSFPTSLSSSSDHRSFNWRWCEGGGLITPDGAPINLERRGGVDAGGP